MTPGSELIIRESPILTSFIHRERARKGLSYRPSLRVVQLECRHFAVTNRTHRTICPRCREMARRGAGWREYRSGMSPDTMRWPKDPAYVFNEPGEGLVLAIKTDSHPMLPILAQCTAPPSPGDIINVLWNESNAWLRVVVKAAHMLPGGETRYTVDFVDVPKHSPGATGCASRC